jgi:alanine dehydrogenase
VARWRAQRSRLCAWCGRCVQLWDLSTAARDRCAGELARSANLDILAAPSLEASLAGADIIVTCTPARRPYLEPHHARPGLFIAAVGADNPEKCEITPHLMARTLIVPDLTDQAAAMGDLRQAIAAGLLTRQDVHGELGEVISGRASARQTDDQIFLFDSTGTALQDVVVASLAIERAAERGLGMRWLSRPPVTAETQE